MPTVLITGANRGLGLAFASQYLADDWQVVALCRQPDKAGALNDLEHDTGQLRVIECDVEDFEAIEAAAAVISDRPIDVLINNAGVFGPKRHADGDLRQSFGHIDYDIWSQILRVNTLAPLKLVEALAENVAASTQKKIVTISSRIGSIGETETGLYAYRTSKAAVNMAMATLANDLAGRNIIVTTFSPGWVKTDMGGDDASLEIHESISRLRRHIADLTTEDNGRFLDYDGDPIPW